MPNATPMPPEPVVGEERLSIKVESIREAVSPSIGASATCFFAEDD